MRKTILILGHNYATQFVDIFNQYTRLFDPQKYKVLVVFLTGQYDEKVKKRVLAEEVIFLDIPKKKLRYLKFAAVKTLVELCKQKNVSLAICHRYKPTYIMTLASKFIQISTLIFVMHELGTMNSIGRQLFIAAFDRKNMLYAGVSNAVRDDMRKKLWSVPKERIVTLYNVIDVELTEPQLFSKEEARQKLRLNDDDSGWRDQVAPRRHFVFGNLARLVKNKDHVTLIKAFSLIKPVCPNAKLIILGEGELENELKTQVKELNLEKDIIFTGFISEGFRYMKAFDCFVLSSIQEAFGRVLIEAMIAKLPIIATRVNGIPEVLGDSNTLVPPRNVQQLAEAMKSIYLMSKDERMEVGKKSYEHAVKNYSIPAFKKEFWGLEFLKQFVECSE